MNIQIHPFPMGVSKSYLLFGDGVILIDCGGPRKLKTFKKFLDKIGLKPDDIKLIVITHGHVDHIGTAKDIKEITGAPIAMHRQDIDFLEKSLKGLPSGFTLLGRISMIAAPLYMPFQHIPSTNVDIVLGDDDFSLIDYGIPGKVLHTPGHTHGSVSVLLETGDAFVGDLVMNMSIRRSPGLAEIGDDLSTMKQSLKKILDQGAKKFYPGHGKPFHASVFTGMVL